MAFLFALLLLAQTARPDAALFDALRAGRWAEALRAAAHLIEADPKNPRLWTARGLAYRGLGRSQESLRAFETALEFSPAYLPALEAAAETSYKARDAKAAVFLKAILERQPSNRIAHAMSGVVAFEAKDCAGAVAHFEQSRPAISGNELALSQLGYCLVSMNRAGEAASAFSEALAANPANGSTRYNVGLAQMVAGRNEEAIATLEPLSLQPGFESDALSLLASAYTACERIADAIAALRKATEVAPKAERNYLDLAVLSMEHQAPELALEIATIGLRNVPQSAGLYAARGSIYATLTRAEEASADFDAAERLMPDKLYGAVGLALLFTQTNQFDKAVATVRQRLASSPDDPTMNFLLADALLRSEGDISSAEAQEARAALLRAVKGRPDFAKAHAELGKIYLKTGETPQALQELRLALTLDSENRVALQQLAIALQRLGKKEEAREIAAKLRQLLAEAREDEKRRNRVALIKRPPQR